MGLELQNRQRSVRVDTAALRQRIAEMMRAQGVHDAELSVVLFSDARVRELNREHRGRDAPTDVLSFEQPQLGGVEDRLLGDIVISAQTAARQAEVRDVELGGVGYSLLDELTFLAAHGLLHLLGHDHQTDEEAEAMEALEAALLAPFSPWPPRPHHGGGAR